MVKVLVGMGSSIGDRKGIFDKVCLELKKLGTGFRVSSYIETEPLGGVAKNMFLNAVCCFNTSILAEDLLYKLQDIEVQFGRQRNKKWEDRTLDLDILYYGDSVINTKLLQVPHTEILKRDFVMRPILELYPDFDFKDFGKFLS